MVKKNKNLCRHFKHRRVWSVISSVVTIIAIHYNLVLLGEITATVAGGLGLYSYMSPKK